MLTPHNIHVPKYLDANGLELYWDRPEEEWPLDAEGHLAYFQPDGRDLNRMVEELLELGAAPSAAVPE